MFVTTKYSLSGATLLLTAVLVSGCGADGAEISTDAAMPPKVVEASMVSRHALNVDRWSLSGGATGYRVLALDAAGHSVATLLAYDREGGEVDFALADSPAEMVTLALDGEVTGANPHLVALAGALRADLHANTVNTTTSHVGVVSPRPQALSPCGHEAFPGNWGVCGTVLLGESRIAVTNNTGCWAYVWSDVLNERATGVAEWILIAPYDTVAFVRWYFGSNVPVYNWEGNCGTITVHH